MMLLKCVISERYLNLLKTHYRRDGKEIWSNKLDRQNRHGADNMNEAE